MTEPNEPAPPLDELASMPKVSHGYQVSMIVQYIERNQARFTEEALVQAARGRGYAEDVVEEARARARANTASAPMKQRARRWILIAYLVTFAVLAIGMFTSPSGGQYGAGLIGTVVLAVTLALAFLLSMGWLGWRGRQTGGPPTGIVILLSIPVVLLIAVAGVCVATGLPIPRLS
jgi:cation transport ATPase